MSSGQQFFDQINRFRLDTELLMGALEAIADMSPEDRKSFEARTIAIIRFIHDQEIPDDKRTDAAMSINFRLMALAKLDSPGLTEIRAGSLCRPSEGYINDTWPSRSSGFPRLSGKL